MNVVNAVTTVGNIADLATQIVVIINDQKARASIRYAKVRGLIEANSPSRAEKRAAKMAVIEVLHGQVMHPILLPHQRSPLPNYVQFGDSTKARF